VNEVNMNADSTPWPDEAPTTPVENVPSKLLAFASRVDRLATLAIERLEVAPDADARLAALADLAQVHALAGTVLR
jgi:hypothetical protein